MIKWIVAYGENGLDESARLLQEQRTGSLRLIAPACSIAEIANVLRYIGVAAEDAAGLLGDISGFGVEMVPDTLQRVRRAIELGFQFRMSVYDALYRPHTPNNRTRAPAPLARASVLPRLAHHRDRRVSEQVRHELHFAHLLAPLARR
jgi:predicted nucleic acid-binding protein